MRKKVFVSGCFDMLHSGHIAFLQEANKYGDVFVGIGSDKNIQLLKNKIPVNCQEERLYNILAIKFVTNAFINKGMGLIDFEEELLSGKFDVFFVNEDGDSEGKRQLCSKLKIEYIVGERIPYQGLFAKSSSAIIKNSPLPYRIDLAGGWLDQPFVSKYCSGNVITVSIEPTMVFNERSGLATSTRNRAIELWNNQLPLASEKNAKILFAYENPPGKQEVSGSQDALSIIMPGLNRLYYDGQYWPQKIESCLDGEILQWIEQNIYLVPLSPRQNSFKVLENTNINEVDAKKLSFASEKCWKAIKEKNIKMFGQAVTESYQAQIAMFPNMVTEEIKNQIDLIKNKVLGYKITGAGGGGYLLCVADKLLHQNVLQIKIRK